MPWPIIPTAGWSARAIDAILKDKNHYNKLLVNGNLSLEDFLILAEEMGLTPPPDTPPDTPPNKNPYANCSRIDEAHHTWHEAEKLSGENGEYYALGDAIPSGKSLTNHVDANQYYGTYVFFCAIVLLLIVWKSARKRIAFSNISLLRHMPTRPAFMS